MALQKKLPITTPGTCDNANSLRYLPQYVSALFNIGSPKFVKSAGLVKMEIYAASQPVR